MPQEFSQKNGSPCVKIFAPYLNSNAKSIPASTPPSIPQTPVKCSATSFREPISSSLPATPTGIPAVGPRFWTPGHHPPHLLPVCSPLQRSPFALSTTPSPPTLSPPILLRSASPVPTLVCHTPTSCHVRPAAPVAYLRNELSCVAKTHIPSDCKSAKALPFTTSPKQPEVLDLSTPKAAEQDAPLNLCVDQTSSNGNPGTSSNMQVPLALDMPGESEYTIASGFQHSLPQSDVNANSTQQHCITCEYLIVYFCSCYFLLSSCCYLVHFIRS